MCVWNLGAEIMSVKWNPNPQVMLLAAITERSVTMLFPEKIANALQRINTEKYFEKDPPNQHTDKVAKRIEWIKPEGKIELCEFC